MTTAILIDVESIGAVRPPGLGIPVKPLLDATRAALEHELAAPRIVVVRAYGDFARDPALATARNKLVDNGADLVHVDQSRQSREGNADVGLAADAISLAFDRPSITTFTVVSGRPASLPPVVDALRRLSRVVIGIVTSDDRTTDAFLAVCDASARLKLP